LNDRLQTGHFDEKIDHFFKQLKQNICIQQLGLVGLKAFEKQIGHSYLFTWLNI